MKNLVKCMALAIAATAFGGCKTTEANYREAYERAVSQREQSTALDSTIYGRIRNEMGSQAVVVGADTFDVKSQFVSPTPDGGAPAVIRPFNVVVGQFKQIFNARSLRQRLVDGGYPDAFIVQTAEPYYYIVLSTHADVGQAVRALKGIPAKFPIAMKDPLPFILRTGR